ncbi:hypothetical protein B8V81_4046 [Paenibacillus pasadenensis]|uniref:Uncharacterized protein n=1 Tax=Paenibacillus pasadenensis TaxID=217090 RepID=A0A2N5N5L2_9BACL|nr:hypothetical protein B8V81_4046 [Paenibacillus pasadenensis]
MSRIEKFGRRRPLDRAASAREESRAESGAPGAGLPPRQSRHPSLRPKLSRLLLRALLFLFIVLSGCLFIWGRSLFVDHSEPAGAAIGKGIGAAP